ncbi:MAG: hypothetical protein CL878_05580 [Dehalococcoidia bacterium]|nr:hypothetical protein [Dehalococcoidia bacterium]
MSLDILLPLGSSVLGLIFAAMLFAQWRDRHKPYQLVWGLGLLWYGLSAGTEFLGNAFGWGEGLYRAWYLIGAIMVAAWLGQGECYLLKTRGFGLLVAAGLVLGSLPGLLKGNRLLAEGDPLAAASLTIGAVGLGAALLVAVVSWLRPAWLGHVTLGLLLVGTLYGAAKVLTVPVDTTVMLHPETGVVHGVGFPEDARLLTPLFNITGALALVFGAAYSAWVWWRQGLYPHRVVSNGLIAFGAFVPSMTSGLNRLGFTDAFYLGEFVGLTLIFIGFLVSIEVFARRPWPLFRPRQAMTG